jgi:hypothetical protein
MQNGSCGICAVQARPPQMSKAVDDRNTPVSFDEQNRALLVDLWRAATGQAAADGLTDVAVKAGPTPRMRMVLPMIGVVEATNVTTRRCSGLACKTRTQPSNRRHVA